MSRRGDEIAKAWARHLEALRKAPEERARLAGEAVTEKARAKARAKAQKRARRKNR